MIQLKFEAQPRGKAGEALEDTTKRLYHRPGGTTLALVELRSVDHNGPSEGEKTARWVKVAVTLAEVPNSDQQADQLRAVQRALNLQRTAKGTLTEDDDLQLSEQTLKTAAGMLQGMEVARLRAGLAHWRGYAQRALSAGDLTHTEVMHELQAIADGLDRVLKAARDDDDQMELGDDDAA